VGVHGRGHRRRCCDGLLDVMWPARVTGPSCMHGRRKGVRPDAAAAASPGTPACAIAAETRPPELLVESQAHALTACQAAFASGAAVGPCLTAKSHQNGAAAVDLLDQCSWGRPADSLARNGRLQRAEAAYNAVNKRTSRRAGWANRERGSRGNTGPSRHKAAGNGRTHTSCVTNGRRTLLRNSTYEGEA
jgi:hypothetical protein